MKVHLNDTVTIIAGNDKGSTGKVLAVFRDKNKVIVEGVNVRVKHKKPQMGQEGGIVHTPLPVHVSNVALVDPKTKKPTRVGYKTEKGKKKRISRKSNSSID